MFQAYGPHLRLPFLPRGRCAALTEHPPCCSFLAARALTGPDGSSGAPGASTLQACAGLCHIRSIAGVPPGHPALGKHTWEPIQVQQGVVFQKWRWTAMHVTLDLIFVALLRKEWSMTFIAVRCPHCQSDQIVKRGKTARGTQRSLCQNTRCAQGSFLLDYGNRGCVPEVKQTIIDRSYWIPGA